MSSIFDELKRRNVIRAALAYLAVSWLIIEVSTTILPLFPEAPAWLPRSIVMVLIVGFFLTLAISWAYELTEKGFRNEAETASGPRPRTRVTRALDFITGGAVVAAIAFFLWTPQQGEVEPSVAVLPFANISADPDNEHLSVGLTETLIHMLAQSPALTVTSRTSVFALKGRDLDVREIGEILGVAHVLEGSVQRSNDQIRITAQLIDTSDGSHLWSQSYDRPIVDIFSIQDEIANIVANALTTSILATPHVLDGVQTAELTAYELYLRAVSARVTATSTAMTEAERLLKEALAIDAGFLDAKTELASLHMFQWVWGFKPQQEAMQSILALTGQVLEKQPSNNRARAVRLGAQTRVAMQAGDPASVNENVDKLYLLAEKSPNDVEIRFHLADALRSLNREQEAREQIEAALLIDPLRADAHVWLAEVLEALGEYEAARVQANQSLEIDPDQAMPYALLARLSEDQLGYIKNLLRGWRQDPSDVDFITPIARRLYGMELFDEGDYVFAHSEAIAPNHGDVRFTKLVRAVAVDDYAESMGVAKDLIENSVPGEHRSGWDYAVKNVLRSGIRLGQGDQALAYIQEKVPGFAGGSSSLVPLEVRYAQMKSIPQLAQLLPHEEMLRLVDELDRFLETLGRDPSETPGYSLPRLLVRGELEEAKQLYLEHYLYVGPWSWERWRLSSPFYADFAADERIQAEMRKAESLYVSSREELRSFIAAEFPSFYRASSLTSN